MSTLPSRVRARAQTTPGRTALREKRLGIWRGITWSEYWDRVALVAHGLANLGVTHGDCVAIHSENRPEWLYADLATLALRGITVGFYPTSPSAEVAYLLNDSGAKILISEDQEQVDKALACIDQCPRLERVIYIEPRGVWDYQDDRLLSFEDLLRLGEEHRARHPELLPQSLTAIDPTDVAYLIYTSGTTGPPKGAMLSVANIEFAIRTLVRDGGIYDPPPGEHDMIVSYLPLCHVAERAATEWVNAEAGVLVHFAESVDTVQQNLREVQPSLFFAVPRIWEKIHASIETKMASASPLKRLNSYVWLRLARLIGDRLVANGGRHTVSTRLMYALGYPFLFRALRDRVGLRKCRAAVSGAAPIAPEVLRFFFGIGVPIHEIYGMTENAAIATVNRPGRVRLGTVGEPQPNIELRLDERTGEVLTRHPGVFVGYWGKPEATRDAITEDGWLRTGDVGEWVDGTHLRIIDRLKDIIITAGGKNISPSEIENSLKASRYIKEAVVVGDRRPYLTVLIGIDAETVGDWALRQRIPYTTYRNLSERPEVLELVRRELISTNSRFARVEQPRKFRMLTKELDHEDGELTATQKVRRSSLEDRFAHLIEDMYSDRADHVGGDLGGIVSVGEPQGEN